MQLLSGIPGFKDNSSPPIPHLALVIGILWVLCLVVYRVYFHPLSHIPGPFLAKISDLYSAYYTWRGENHYHLYRLHKKHGLVVRYGPNRVTFNSAVAIKEIYGTTKPLKKSAGYRALILRGNAYSTFSAIDKTLHGRKRRILGYGFSDAALRSYESVVQERVNKFCELLVQSPDSNGWGQVKNMTRLCAGLTFDVMAALIFGRPFRILEDETGAGFVIDAINAGAKSAGVFFQIPSIGKNEILFKFRAFLRLFFLGIKDLKNVKNFIDLSQQMTKERSEKEAACRRGEDLKITEGVPQKDIFSYILEARDPETGEAFNADELWVEARVLIVAGSDTTSTTLCGAFYYLSRHPQILLKLRSELHSAFATEDDIRPGQKLNGCSYLRAVIDESLRMAGPVAAALWRETTADHSVEGYKLPKGTDVAVPAYAIHHNTDFFPDPHIFNPDRWDETIAGVHAVAAARSAWIAFQTGSRWCIGRPLAMLELTLTIARVVYSYDIKVDEAQESKSDIQVSKGITEFWTIDQLTAQTIGPYLRFRKIPETEI